MFKKIPSRKPRRDRVGRVSVRPARWGHRSVAVPFDGKTAMLLHVRMQTICPCHSAAIPQKQSYLSIPRSSPRCEITGAEAIHRGIAVLLSETSRAFVSDRRRH